MASPAPALDAQAAIVVRDGELAFVHGEHDGSSAGPAHPLGDLRGSKRRELKRAFESAVDPELALVLVVEPELSFETVRDLWSLRDAKGGAVSLAVADGPDARELAAALPLDFLSPPRPPIPKGESVAGVGQVIGAELGLAPSKIMVRTHKAFEVPEIVWIERGPGERERVAAAVDAARARVDPDAVFAGFSWAWLIAEAQMPVAELAPFLALLSAPERRFGSVHVGLFNEGMPSEAELAAEVARQQQALDQLFEQLGRDAGG